MRFVLFLRCLAKVECKDEEEDEARASVARVPVAIKGRDVKGGQ
jgi:hypothetical protein